MNIVVDTIRKRLLFTGKLASSSTEAIRVTKQNGEAFVGQHTLSILQDGVVLATSSVDPVSGFLLFSLDTDTTAITDKMTQFGDPDFIEVVISLYELINVDDENSGIRLIGTNTVELDNLIV